MEKRGGDHPSNSVDVGWYDPKEGVGPIARELMTGDLTDRSTRILAVPTSRMVAEAKQILAGDRAVLVNGLVTYDRLALHLYDLLKGDIPVAHTSLRDMYVYGSLDRIRPPSLTGGRKPRSGIVRMVSEIFGELLGEDVDPARLKRTCRSRRSLDLLTLYSEYYSVLRKRDFIDPDLLHREVLSLLETRGGELGEVILGIHLPVGLTRGQEMVLSSLMGISSRTRVRLSPFHPIPDIIKIPPKGPLPEMDISIPAADHEGIQGVISSKRPSIIRGRDRADEVREICRTLKVMIAKGEVDPGDVAIVFPRRESYLKPVQSIFPDHSIPFDMTHDLALSECPPVAAVMKLLECIDRGYPRDPLIGALSSPFLTLRSGSKKLDGRSVDLLLRECFIFGGGGDIQGEWIRPLNEGLRDHEGEEIVQVISSLTELLHMMEEVRGGEATVTDFNGRIITLLKHLSFLENTEENIRKGEEIEEADEGQGPYQFQGGSVSELFKCMRVLDVNATLKEGGNIDFRSYMLLLRSVVEKVKLRSTPRREGVEIMGMKEFMGLNRKMVIFCGMVQGDLPSYHHGFSILSDEERASLGLLPLNETRPQLEGLCLAMSGAGTSLISLHERRGESISFPSHFIRNILGDDIERPEGIYSRRELYRALGRLSSDEEGSINGSTAGPTAFEQLLSHVGHREERIRNGRMERLRRSTGFTGDDRGVIRDDALVELLGNRYGQKHIWSASRLDTYRECPYRFFIDNVLSIRELRDLDPEVPADKRGSIFHTIVELFFRRWVRQGHERITPEDLEGANRMILTIADEVLSGYAARGPYWEAMRDHLVGSGSEPGVLQELLRKEASYKGPFTVERTEFGFGGVQDDKGGVEIRTGLQGGLEEVLRLRGSIDRIDSAVIGDRRSLFLWDYKTGRNIPSKESLQIPLYLAAMRSLESTNDTVGGGYIHVNRRGVVERVPALGGGILDDDIDQERVGRIIEGLDMVLKESVTAAMGYVDAIRGGRFELPARCKSSFCNYSDICRRDE